MKLTKVFYRLYRKPGSGEDAGIWKVVYAFHEGGFVIRSGEIDRKRLVLGNLKRWASHAIKSQNPQLKRLKLVGSHPDIDPHGLAIIEMLNANQI